MFRSLLLCGLCLVSFSVWADGPADNNTESVRQIPPPGIEIPQEDKQKLETGLAELNEIIDRLKLRRDARTPQLLTDVEIYARAIDQVLKFGEIYSPGEIKQAHEVLAEGLARAKGLQNGDTPWLKQTGLVVRGYRSKLDGTVQPYGLVIPNDYDGGKPFRCDLWFHGRGEKSLEVQFIAQRMKNAGQFQPEGTIVLHPFGRYSNAFKFAGEVDVWEALAHAQQNYNIDANRVAVRGFSMGGAGAWHFAVHYPRKFFAANPGAGFSETPEFLKSFQGETLNPPVYEERLWNMYDCPPWVENLRLVPTIAYSGEIDRQKQAADVMEAACKAKGMELVHLIGPQTAHAIHKDSAVEIESRLRDVELHQPDLPQPFRAVTWTLQYHNFGMVDFLGLQEHWTRSEATVSLEGHAAKISTTGVTALQINLPGDELPSAGVFINGQQMKPEGTSFVVHLADGQWKPGATPGDQLRKRPGLQGPIDDAFMDSFLFVTPGGTAQHPAVEKWVQSELDHARTHWRQQMRGDARIKSDSDITDADIADHNLILWGDPASNKLIAKVLPQLPLKWTKESVTIGSNSYPAISHAPVLIYPNPLNPKRYVVLNSGFTYREYDYLNNARQTPKLPDWGIIDLSTPPGPRWPGKVAAADFFNEFWQIKP